MDVLEILGRPTIGSVMGLYWIPFFLGIIVGWSWKPKWASLGFCIFHLSALSSSTVPISPSSLLKNMFSFRTTQSLNSESSTLNNNEFAAGRDQILVLPNVGINPVRSSSHAQNNEHLAVTEEDLVHLWQLVERKDGGPLWKQMMDCSTPNMSYQAWQRDDPATGPPQYYTRTVYEDATPEMLRDFFWDDEFRLKWDDMMLHATTIDECPTTGTMAVHWIRKFPFFCSDREYTIGRRIWESAVGRTYYCVTKGVHCPSVPRRQKPTRVDLYYSSWFIQAVASEKGNDELTACEVLLFHHEDMHLPWKIAKIGVKRGMWGAVKKIEAGFRAYQMERAFGSSISHTAVMAQINTKVDLNHLISSMERNRDLPETNLVSLSEKTKDRKIQKLVIIGGVVFLACGFDPGLITKAVIYGVARKFTNKGRRAC